jgi:hypothetical protein
MNRNVQRWLPLFRGSLQELEKRAARFGTPEEPIKSLAMLAKHGAKVEKLAGEFVAPFHEVELADMNELLHEWITTDRPDFFSVQSVLMAFASLAHGHRSSCWEELFESLVEAVDTRSMESEEDAWWAQMCIHRFTTILPAKTRLGKTVRNLDVELRRITPARAAH